VGGFLFGLTFLVLGITLGLRWVSDAVEDQATGLAQRAMGTVTGDSSTQVSIHSSPPILYRIPWPEMG
jgi:hypothetical protein